MEIIDVKLRCLECEILNFYSFAKVLVYFFVLYRFNAVFPIGNVLLFYKMNMPTSKYLQVDV